MVLKDGHRTVECDKERETDRHSDSKYCA